MPLPFTAHQVLVLVGYHQSGSMSCMRPPSAVSRDINVAILSCMAPPSAWSPLTFPFAADQVFVMVDQSGHLVMQAPSQY